MLDDLRSRIRRLERENRLHRAALALLTIAALSCGSGITSNFALVRTGRLELVDGEERSQMTLTAGSGGAVIFHGPDGAVQLDAATVAKLLATPGEPPK